MFPSSAEAVGRYRAAFSEAARAGETLGSLTVAGRGIEVRIAGERLARVVHRALPPLVGAGRDEARLRVELWSRAETGVGMPPATTADEETPRGDQSDALRVTCGDGRYLRYERPATATLWLDRQERRIVGCFESVEELTQYERGRPLHAVLVPWLEDEGLRVVHAGLVGVGGRGLLLPGAAGRGKTTCVVVAALAGLDWTSDDVTALERADAGRWRCHGLYRTAKLDREHLRRFPDLVPLAEPDSSAREPKALIFLDEARAGRFVPSSELAALAFPRVVDGSSTLVPLPGAEALRALISGTLRVTGRGLHRAMFESLGELVGSVPSYTLEASLDGPGMRAAIERAVAQGPTAGGLR